MRESTDMRHEGAPAGAADLPLPEAVETVRPVTIAKPDLYRTLLENMREGVSLAAEDGTIVYTNPAEDHMFGYGPGELVGRHVSVQNAYPPDENARLVGEVIAELKRSGHWRGEWLNRRKDGSSFITTSRISAVEIEGRAHWLCVQEDVTADRAALAALRDSEARLEVATAAAALGIWDWDLAQGHMTYSPRAKAISGFAPDREVTIKDVRGIVHPEDLPFTSAQARRALDPAIRDRSPYEYRIVRPDGALRWVLAHGEAVFGEFGGETRAIRYIGTLQDVTERRRLEETERASAQRLQLAIDAGRMAVWEVDLVHHTVTGSPELNRLLGFPEKASPTLEEMRERYYPGERERLQAIAHEILERGERFMEAEHRYLWPDGSVRWLLLRCEFLLEEGRPTRAVGVVTDVTERRRTEDELRASEARLSLAQKAAGAAVWDWDVRSNQLIWSPELYAIYDFDPARTTDLYTAWMAAVHPDDRDWADATARRAADEGEAFSMDFRAYTAGGELRWIRSQGIAVVGPDGRPVRVAGINIDVTDQHRQEERLRAQAETLESRVEERTRERDRIWNLSPDLMCVARVDGTLVSVNPAWERLLGWPLDWLTGRNAAEIKHPDDAERTAGELASLAAGRPTTNFQDRYRHKDGSWRWISWVIQPTGDLIYCVGRDVTQERETRAALQAAEAARREADALYRAYFSTTAEALFVVGVRPDGRFTLEELNPAHEAATGLRTKDIRGKPLEEQLPPEVAQAVAANYRRAVEAGVPISYRETVTLAGETQHWDTVLAPLRGQDGRIDRIVGSGRDVTKQVMAEEALRQSQKMEAVGQLTGGIAHDFNNLLGAIVGSLDLIRRKPTDTDRVRRFAEAGLQAAERGARLTSQLLAFSRAQRIELKPLLVSELVVGMREMLTQALGPMVRLNLHLEEGQKPVLSDPTQLEMAVLNLAINARDAMPDGGELTIATVLRRVNNDIELGAGEYVELSVTDTGVGMSPEVMARAFDPFFTTKGVGKGTGLGLSQVYGIAQQAGGAVRIESRPGTGTTVRLYLPKTDTRIEAGVELEADGDATAGPAATILVVDDDLDMRRMLVASLETLGYRVLEAADGSAGLAALAAGNPDLLMVDFAMPGMNGAEVAKAARERQPDLPIVFASGYAETAAIESVAGHNVPVLRKPFRLDDLQAIVAETLNRLA